MMLKPTRLQQVVCGAILAAVGAVGYGPAAWAGDHKGEPFEFEDVPAAESDEIDETTALTVELQDVRAANDESQKGMPLRGVHAKSHGCVRAEFVVRGDIEEQYQVGLFSQPGKVYDALIRFSNAAVLVEHDLSGGKNGSRGMAIKIMDVEGDMLSTDDGRSNQDFLMINTPEFAFANVRDYLRLNRILALSEKGNVAKPYFLPLQLDALGAPQDGEPADKAEARRKLEAIMASIPAFNDFREVDLSGTKASINVITRKIELATVRNPMQVQYFGAAPFLFGEGRAMKFSVAPCTTIKQARFDPKTITDDDPSENYLSDAVSQTMQGIQNVCYDFKVKVRSVDADRLNIEDATTTWPDDGTDFVNVARITVKAPQSPDTTEAREQCEQLAFSPWHSLADHQPLGGINRLRGDVYSASASNRGAGGE